MLALSFNLEDPMWWLAHPISLLGLLFQLWMLVDAIRRREWLWVFLILIFSVITALWYYLQVYRTSPSSLQGFELPGAGNRRRIRELEARIHHLDHARDHLDLADVYFRQGKLAQAEKSYRASLERDASDIDAIAHLGQCLLRQGRAAEARPLLEQTVAKDPRHDYSHTLMALAEAQHALGDDDAALQSWQRVLSTNSYARARVQYAELLLTRGQVDEAAKELRETIADDLHVPKFQRGRDRFWIRRARKLLTQNG